MVYPVQATRGCPFTCEYCSIAAVYNGMYRKRPVDQIVRDVEATRSRNINFCDDNLCEDVKFADRTLHCTQRRADSLGNTNHDQCCASPGSVEEGA